jgi:hypothetical protein
MFLNNLLNYNKMDKILSKISSIKQFNKLYQIPHQLPLNCNRLNNINLLLLNAPCNGFGDLIFAKKLADHLRKTFKIKVTIATTEPEKLLLLGENSKYLKKLASIGKATQKVRPCRIFSKLRLYDIDKNTKSDISKFNLFFVAPLSFDYDPKISDIKPLVPFATKFNTFFFSEYNDTIRKDFDFHTGVGNNRDGILLTKPEIISKNSINKLLNTKKFGSFSLIYVADIDKAVPCIKGFLEMISKKYNGNKFQIIIPQFLYKDVSAKNFVSYIFSKYWNKITILSKNKEPIVYDGNGSGHLTIRFDILPVKNKIMMGLIRHSVKDILLTGDQSISDALSCCADKNIFYQIAPWKTDFGKNMAKYMPNKYLRSTKTSCGNLSAINYKSNYSTFIKKHNFFKNVHNRLKSILCMTQLSTNHNYISQYIDIVNSSRSIKQVKNKILDLSKSINTRKSSKRLIRQTHKSRRKSSRKKSSRKSRRKSSRKSHRNSYKTNKS